MKSVLVRVIGLAVTKNPWKTYQYTRISRSSDASGKGAQTRRAWPACATQAVEQATKDRQACQKTGICAVEDHERQMPTGSHHKKAGHSKLEAMHGNLLSIRILACAPQHVLGYIRTLQTHWYIMSAGPQRRMRRDHRWRRHRLVLRKEGMPAAACAPCRVCSLTKRHRRTAQVLVQHR